MDNESSDDPGSTFITRVGIKNYKSIAACDVALGPLTFLVGPNGAGKSNFLDALRFINDALRTSLDHALRDRGGIQEVRRLSTGHPRHFTIRVDFRLPDQRLGYYVFEVAAAKEGGYLVKQESCLVRASVSAAPQRYTVREGQVIDSTLATAPAVFPDRLYLVNVSGLPEFRPVFESLSQMGFYNLNPDRIRELQSPDPGDVLARDGSNAASVIAKLQRAAPDTLRRIEDYLSKIVLGVEGVARKDLGPKLTLEFRQTIKGSKKPWSFLAANMSDGTLRALGILVALFQSVGTERGVPLVAVEEPEIALHPAAAGVLLDALREASRNTQVLVTSHSPDLLDSVSVSDKELLSVISEQNETKIGRLDEAGRSALKEHLYTAGELLKMNQFVPADDSRALDPEQLSLLP